MLKVVNRSAVSSAVSEGKKKKDTLADVVEKADGKRKKDKKEEKGDKFCKPGELPRPSVFIAKSRFQLSVESSFAFALVLLYYAL